MNKQSGFTLIELMIVVAIIAILAAIALPQYNKYTQRSANSACLAEAKAYMSTGVADAANNETPDTFNAKACETGTNMTTTLYASDGNLTFTPKTRGGTPKAVTCKGSSGTCAIAS